MVARRSDALHLAVLGLLHEAPLHGYELRTRLDLLIGALRRRISFGSLYPALRALELGGFITRADDAPRPPALALPARRRRVVYRLTPAGERHLEDLLAVSGPATWEDGQFDVHFAFFARTDAETRLRILAGRRARIHERLERAHQTGAGQGAQGGVIGTAGTAGPGPRRDSYLAELARHRTDSLERELSWLDDVIERERATRPPAP